MERTLTLNITVPAEVAKKSPLYNYRPDEMEVHPGQYVTFCVPFVVDEDNTDLLSTLYLKDLKKLAKKGQGMTWTLR